MEEIDQPLIRQSVTSEIDYQKSKLALYLVAATSSMLQSVVIFNAQQHTNSTYAYVDDDSVSRFTHSGMYLLAGFVGIGIGSFFSMLFLRLFGHTKILIITSLFLGGLLACLLGQPESYAEKLCLFGAIGLVASGASIIPVVYVVQNSGYDEIPRRIACLHMSWSFGFIFSAIIARSIQNLDENQSVLGYIVCVLSWVAAGMSMKFLQGRKEEIKLSLPFMAMSVGSNSSRSVRPRPNISLSTYTRVTSSFLHFVLSDPLGTSTLVLMILWFCCSFTLTIMMFSVNFSFYYVPSTLPVGLWFGIPALLGDVLAWIMLKMHSESNSSSSSTTHNNKSRVLYHPRKLLRYGLVAATIFGSFWYIHLLDYGYIILIASISSAEFCVVFVNYYSVLHVLLQNRLMLFGCLSLFGRALVLTCVFAVILSTQLHLVIIVSIPVCLMIALFLSVKHVNGPYPIVIPDWMIENHKNSVHVPEEIGSVVNRLMDQVRINDEAVVLESIQQLTDMFSWIALQSTNSPTNQEEFDTNNVVNVLSSAVSSLTLSIDKRYSIAHDKDSSRGSSAVKSSFINNAYANNSRVEKFSIDDSDDSSNKALLNRNDITAKDEIAEAYCMCVCTLLVSIAGLVREDFRFRRNFIKESLSQKLFAIQDSLDSIQAQGNKDVILWSNSMTVMIVVGLMEFERLDGRRWVNLLYRIEVMPQFNDWKARLIESIGHH